MSQSLDRLRSALAGRYTIERELGSGGMATVYLAEDVKHHRMVAIKVLKSELAAALGPERFIREIETAARLHHPHILPLYDSGEAGGSLYYVMPYVEGESLRQRLDREKQLPLEDALHIAREVADALSYAHSHDVVHRDIKPENILLEADHALVADFGIATAISKAGGEHLTATGLALGTPSYMSPEQAGSSSEIDGRSDLYSLGCVLYEMLAGQPPFTGPTVESIIHQHLATEPPLVSRIRPAVPAHIAGTIARALAKTPADRFSPAAQFAEALKPAGSVSLPVVEAGMRTSNKTLLVAGTVIVAAILVLLVRQALTSPPAILPAAPQQVTFRGDVMEATLSPDGQFVAYMIGDGANATKLFVQDLEGGAPVELFTSDQFFCCVQWSPDGSQVVFRDGPRSRGTAVIMPRLGGPPRRLIADVSAVWSPDGTRLLSWWPQAKRLWVTDVSRGDTSGSVPLGEDHDWLSSVDWSPDGDMLAFITLREGTSTLWTALPDGERKQLVLADTLELDSPTWAPRGDALYYERNVDERTWDVWKVGISGDGTARGSPTRILSGLAIGRRFAVIPALSISADGKKLLYIRSIIHSNLWLYQIDRSRADGIGSIKELTTGTALRSTPRLSPDGREIAYLQSEARGRKVFTMPVSGQSQTQITSLEADTWSPTWSPDGKALAFGTVRDGLPMIGVVNVVGGLSRALAENRFETGNLLVWAPAERIIYQQPGDQNYTAIDPASGEDYALIPDTSYGWLYDPRPSPDGNWVAVWWNLGAVEESGLWLLSTEGGAPVPVVKGFIPVGWSADATTVYAFRTNNRRTPVRELYAIDVRSKQPRIHATLPEAVMPWNVTISPDGTTLVAAVEEKQSDAWIIENFDPRNQ